MKQQLSKSDEEWIKVSWEKFKHLPPWRHFVEDAEALCHAIEKIPASRQQTDASIKAAALRGLLEEWRQHAVEQFNPETLR